jgi:hypothetical protein
MRMTSAEKNLWATEQPQPGSVLFLFRQFRCEVNMSALLTAAVIGTALLALAIWIEIRERRVEPGDGRYRSSEPPQT